MTEKEKIPKVRFLDGEKDDIRRHIDRMITRHTYADPFPLGSKDIIEMTSHTIPDDVMDNIKALVAWDAHILSSRSSMETTVDGTNGASIRVYNGETKVYFYETRSRHLAPTSEFHAPVQKWMLDVIDRIATTTEFNNHVRRVLQYSNTPGQVKTVFPTLIELLPERMHEALKRSTRATRWPDGLVNEQESFLQTSKKFENMVMLLKMVSNAPRKSNRFDVTVRIR